MLDTQDICECGRGPKVATHAHSALQGCEACNRLDGKTPRQRDIVFALRNEGSLSTRELANRFATSIESMRHTMRRLLAAGVVKRRLSERRTVTLSTKAPNQKISRSFEQPITETVWRLAATEWVW